MSPHFKVCFYVATVTGTKVKEVLAGTGEMCVGTKGHLFDRCILTTAVHSAVGRSWKETTPEIELLVDFSISLF